ncbi:MAG: ATP-binding protein [Candidatus Saganbacteria bacterium]|nr:ATP-binding protein [Candidatus Saganbacteria bacterium]
MNKTILREIVSEQREMIKKKDLGIEREKLALMEKYIKMPHVIVISGMRRVGKSTLLAQIIDKYYKDSFYYLNFEDERLMDFKVSDFNALYEVFIELFGEKKTFFFDEIQNIKGWERFVRRMHESGFKFFITGSNASLLSAELGTKLTGRFLPLELFPFSFREFLILKGYNLSKKSLTLTKERGGLKRLFAEYLKEGGMPEYLKYQDKDVLKRVYNDILYRDIVARYKIKEVEALRETALYFLSNISSLFSYNKLKQALHLGSSNTIKNFADRLQNSYMVFILNIFSYSLKQQYIAPKKICCVDNGMADAVSFKFSENKGAFLENLVGIELKRRGENVFYYKSAKGFEVDFLIKKGRKIDCAIQVAQSLERSNVKDREFNALLFALKEFNLKQGLVLTEDEEDEVSISGKKILIKPLYKWILE